jgi:CelD/BcsL family acetyltransferase involved in cellulose biosynthesis
MSPTQPAAAVARAPVSPDAHGPRINVARSAVELEALLDRYTGPPIRSLDADPDWLLTVVEQRPEAERPHVMLLERPDGRQILIVGRLEALPLAARIGYLTLAKPTVRTLFVVAGGIVGVQDDGDRRAVTEALQGVLAAREAELVMLSALPVEDPLFAMARAAVPWARRGHVPESAPRWTADIPDRYDAFLATRSRNTRENVKRYGKKLLKAHGDELEVRLFTREEELEEVCRDLDAVAANTYQRGLGVAFAGDAQELALMRLGMRKDWFRAWVLSIAGKPVAFWHGYRYGGSFGTFSPGFDPAFADLRVGLYLQMRMIETLCEDPDVDRLDFGSGDAQYKRSYGDHCTDEATLLLFGPGLRAARINLLQSAVALAARTAKRLATESELGRKLKKGWRDRLAARGGSGA